MLTAAGLPRFPVVIELPYRDDSACLFETVVDQAWAVFLDSAGAGRYDIIAADPSVRLVTRGQTTEIRSRAGCEVSADDPFALLRRVMDAMPAHASPLPFAGGALGYFAYDLGQRIERRPARVRDTEGFPEMAVGIYDWAVVVDHAERRTWLGGVGCDDSMFPQWDDLAQRFSHPPDPKVRPSFRALAPVKSSFSRDAYAAAVRRILEYIRAGDCYQVNLAQRFSVPVTGDPWVLYQSLRRSNPAPYSAYLHYPWGRVLSCSPERFLRVRDGTVETRPIKGTRRRAADAAQDEALKAQLSASDKDRAENLMIVDLLRNDLGKSCAVGSVKVPRMFEVESFATVHHLVSTVTGCLAPGTHALDLMRGCFPGGSITGAPKLRAMQIIEDLEPHRRGVYCGSIGYIGCDGAMDTSIVIRTLVVSNGEAYFWAGGGVVSDSSIEGEYQESLDKAAAFFAALGQ